MYSSEPPKSPLEVYSDADGGPPLELNPVWLPLPPNTSAVAISSYSQISNSSGSGNATMSSDNIGGAQVSTFHIFAASRLTVGDIILLFEAYLPDGNKIEPTWYRGCVFAGTSSNQKRDAPPVIGVFPASHLMLCQPLPTESEISNCFVSDVKALRSLKRDKCTRTPDANSAGLASNPRIAAITTRCGSRDGMLGSGDVLQYSVPNLETSVEERQHGANAAVSLNKLLPDMIFPSSATASYNSQTHGVHATLLKFSTAAMRDWAHILENGFRLAPQNLSLCAKAYQKIFQLSNLHSQYASLTAVIPAKQQKTQSPLSMQSKGQTSNIDFLRMEIVRIINIGNAALELPQVVFSLEKNCPVSTFGCTMRTLLKRHGTHDSIHELAPSTAIQPADVFTFSDLRNLHLQTEPRSANSNFGSPISVGHASKLSLNVTTPNQHSPQLISVGSPDAGKAHAPPLMLYFELLGSLPVVAPQSTEVEFRFSIYSKALNRSITDDFVLVTDDAHGIESRMQPMAPFKALFTEFSAAELSTDIFLICKVIRMAPLREGAVTGDSSCFRRPVAAGVVDIRELASSISQAAAAANALSASSVASNAATTANQQLSAPGNRDSLYAASLNTNFIAGSVSSSNLGILSGNNPVVGNFNAPAFIMKLYEALNETSFSTIVSDLVTRTGNVNPLKCDGIAIALRVAVDIPIISASFASNVLRVQRSNLPETLNPVANARNTLYINLESAELHRNLGKSFEIELSIRDKQNKPILNGIMQHDGSHGKSHRFCTLYHCLTPKWNETCRIDLGAERFSSAYLCFTVIHCSKTSTEVQDRRAAIGIVPIMNNDGAVFQNDSNTITLYKFDRKIFETCSQISELINSSSNSALKLQQLKETLSFSSLLVSTFHTQVVSIAKVQNIFSNSTVPNSASLVAMLREFKNAPSIELAKFCVPCMKSLISLICTKSYYDSDVEKMTFNNILHLITTVFQERENKLFHFRAILQNFFDAELSQIDGGIRIMNFVSKLVDSVRKNTTDLESIRQLHATFKSLNWLFLMIVRCGIVANENAKENEKSESSETFHKELRAFLLCITNLMSDSSDHVAAIQQFAFLTFPQVISSLLKVLEMSEAVEFTIKFVDAQVSPRPSMMQKKLSFIKAIVENQIFDKDSQPHKSFYLTVLRWVSANVSWLLDSASASCENSLRTQILSDCTNIISLIIDKYIPLVEEKLSKTECELILGISDILPTLGEAFELNALQLPQTVSSHSRRTTLFGNFSTNYSNSQVLFAAQSSEASNSSIPTSSTLMAQNSNQFLSPTAGMPSSGNSNNSNLSVPMNNRASRSITAINTLRQPSISAVNAMAEKHTTSQPLSQLVTISKEKDSIDTSPEIIRLVTIYFTVIDSFSEDMLQEHFLDYFSTKGVEKTLRFMGQCFSFIEMALIGETYPSHWLNLKISIQRNSLKLLFAFSTILTQNILPSIIDGSLIFDIEFWANYFKRIMILLTFEHTSLLKFGAQAWLCSHESQTPNMMLKGGRLLNRLWHEIGLNSSMQKISDYQVQIIPQLLRQTLELSACNLQSLFQCGTRLLCRMIKQDIQFYNSKKHIENILVDCLDDLIMDNGRCDERYRLSLLRFMRGYFIQYPAGGSFFSTMESLYCNIDGFISSILAYRSLPAGSEYEDEQWNGMYKLARFMKSIERNDIYLRYVHILASKQASSGNYLEAAWTLKLHSDILSWSDTMLEAAPNIGFDKPQKEHDRKENLLLQVLDNFNGAKAWESAIVVCKELMTHYDTVKFDFVRQSENMQLMSELYRSIAEEERYFSEYFRVGYYGLGFPTSLRNKQFIYRGQELEKIASFMERIQSKHPDSLIVKSNALPDEDILQSKQRWLQITAVNPEPDLTNPVFQSHLGVPEAIKKYYKCNNVRKFSVSRPFRKGAKTDNEFLSLWTEKTTYVTENVFPYLLRRSEVIECYVTEYSPVQNAVISMQTKNNELVVLERKWEKINDPQANCNPFTMCLNGAVDAPVNGGVNMYKKAFINSNYAAENPEYEEWPFKLAECIDEQVQILHRCLIVHRRVVLPQLLPLHENIVILFAKNFAEEIERLGIDVSVHSVPLSQSSADAPKTKEGFLSGTRLASYGFSSKKGNKKATAADSMLPNSSNLSSSGRGIDHTKRQTRESSRTRTI